jgi:hypothetical protein
VRVQRVLNKVSGNRTLADILRPARPRRHERRLELVARFTQQLGTRLMRTLLMAPEWPSVLASGVRGDCILRIMQQFELVTILSGRRKRVMT